MARLLWLTPLTDANNVGIVHRWYMLLLGRHEDRLIWLLARELENGMGTSVICYRFNPFLVFVHRCFERYFLQNFPFGG